MRIADRGCVLGLVLAAIGLSSVAYGQTYTGVQSCGGSECHTKNGEIEWLTKKPGGQEHRGALGKIRQAKENSDKYAKAVKLASFEDPKGMCVKCHATYVEVAKTLEGVGCEGCHGPASGYREFHSQNPKDQAGSVKRGLRDLNKKPTTWIKTCKGCHVLDGNSAYDALLDAGHKDGKRWRVEDKFDKVAVHWKNVTYTAAVIKDADAGKAPTNIATPPGGATSGGGSGTAEPPKTETKAIDKPADPVKSVETKSGEAKGGREAKKPVEPTSIEPKKTASKEPTGPTAIKTEVVTTPVSNRSEPVIGPGAFSPLTLPLPAPVSATGFLAALQDRAVGLLESLLRSNTVPPTPLKVPAIAPRVTGPDAELLQLQAEALALAVEALNLRTKNGSSAGVPTTTAPKK
jgi:hypothetical protein